MSTNRYAAMLRSGVMVRTPLGTIHPLDAPELIEAADELDRLQAENSALWRCVEKARAAIKDAYGEGWSDGGHSAESYHHGYGSHDFDAVWLASDAMRAADKALVAEGE